MQTITSPSGFPATQQPVNEGLRAARGLGVVENPRDDLDPDGRWRTGWRFRRARCNQGYRTAYCGTDSLDWADFPRPGVRSGTPFVVGAAVDCSTFGLGGNLGVADLEAEATRALNLVTYAQIGAELWRGDQAQASGWDNPYLRGDVLPPSDPNAGNPDPEFVNLMTENSLSSTTAAFDPTVALAALEDALAACTPGLRLIHAPRAVVTVWGMGGTLRYEGGRLFTPGGTQIVTESSYDGSGPISLGSGGNPALGGMWVYGTGPVLIRQDSDVVVTSAVDRSTNDALVRAERLAMVTWDCCWVGIRVAVSQ